MENAVKYWQAFFVFPSLPPFFSVRMILPIDAVANGTTHSKLV
jgi:hypothetical protein